MNGANLGFNNASKAARAGFSAATIVLAAPGWLFCLLMLFMQGMPGQEKEGAGMMLGMIGLPITAGAGIISVILGFDKWFGHLQKVKAGKDAGKSPFPFLALLNLPYAGLLVYFLYGIIRSRTG
jgi:hypothetical protein